MVDIPRFVVDHTFFHSLWREIPSDVFRIPAKDLFAYFLIRQLKLKPRDKVAETTLEVADDVFSKIWNPEWKYWLLPYVPKPIDFSLMINCIELDMTTYSMPPKFSPMDSIIFRTLDCLNSGNDVILISNIKNAKDLVLSFLFGREAVGWGDTRKKSVLYEFCGREFVVMNVIECVNFLKQNETDETIKKYINTLKLFELPETKEEKTIKSE